MRMCNQTAFDSISVPRLEQFSQLPYPEQGAAETTIRLGRVAVISCVVKLAQCDACLVQFLVGVSRRSVLDLNMELTAASESSLVMSKSGNE